MNKSVETIRKTRANLVNSVKVLSIEQLNHVPAGFNNNIIWNLGHMVATQQGTCYKRAGLQMLVPDNFFATYMPGTKPERPVAIEEFEEIEQLMFTTLDQLEADMQNNLFANYPTWTTRYGVDITGLNDLLIFLPFHEGLHSATVTALKRLV